MVLQRAPQQAVVWGYVPKGESVVVTLDSGPALPAAHADGNGTWRVRLPPTLAGGPHTIEVTASTGGKQTLTDILFGDVFLCGGQSECMHRPGLSATVSLTQSGSCRQHGVSDPWFLV